MMNSCQGTGSSAGCNNYISIIVNQLLFSSLSLFCSSVCCDQSWPSVILVARGKSCFSRAGGA